MQAPFVRIDDRLIHGQVVLGWASALNANAIILCDNEVYANSWEKELYQSCTPEHIKTSIMNEEMTARQLQDGEARLARTIVLINSPYVAEHLVAFGVGLKEINVGGLHYRDGRKNYLPYLYMDEDEAAAFKRLMQHGIRCVCLDVPTGTKVDLKTLL